MSVENMAERLACELMPSPDFIGMAEFVKTKERTLRIEKVTREELQFKSKETKVVVAFEGATKRLILNKTNMRSIVARHGSAVKDWIGKDITLYFDPDVKIGRRRVGGVRIK